MVVLAFGVVSEVGCVPYDDVGAEDGLSVMKLSSWARVLVATALSSS
jgi:hypothetical protein